MVELLLWSLPLSCCHTSGSQAWAAKDSVWIALKPLTVPTTFMRVIINLTVPTKVFSPFPPWKAKLFIFKWMHVFCCFGYCNGQAFIVIILWERRGFILQTGVKVWAGLRKLFWLIHSCETRSLVKVCLLFQIYLWLNSSWVFIWFQGKFLLRFCLGWREKKKNLQSECVF